MFMIRRIKMDSTLIGQQWAKFMNQQINLLNSKPSVDKKDENDLTSNPFYSKYANKLKNKNLDQTKSQQLFDLNDEEKKMKEKLMKLEKKIDFNSDQERANRTPSKTVKKKLDEIIKLDLIKNLNKDEIKSIWFEYFKNKNDTIFACLDAKSYDQIKDNVIKYPTFVFLLPINDSAVKDNQIELNKNSYQFILVQFQTSEQSFQCYFTPLAFYHTHKENAPATFVLNYHAELKQDKGIVLMEGEYDNKIFNLLEAQCLTNQIQIFYSNKCKKELLDNFTNNPNQFDFMDIVKEFEKSIKI